jgi:hypothetical protein
MNGETAPQPKAVPAPIPRDPPKTSAVLRWP